MYLYVDNQIQPTFRAQSFIQEDTSVDLNNNLVGFRYLYNFNTSLDQVQSSTNTTYLVFVPQFQFLNYDDYELIPLDIIECQDPQLDGFHCLDFSKIQNYTLISAQNNKIWSSIIIYAYTCQDAKVKNIQVSNNCASENDIDTMINSGGSAFQIKLQTSQYNITKKQIQTNYRNQYIDFYLNEFIISDFKTQKQITQVKQGPFIQEETTFSSPIQYSMTTQSFDRANQIQQLNNTALLQVFIEMDEIAQFFFISYPTFPQVLAVCNSILALFMCVGVLGRSISQQLIKQDIFLLILQNIHQGKYLELLKKNKLIAQENQNQQQESYQKDIHEQDFMQSETQEPIKIPAFLTKSRQSVDQNALSPHLLPSINNFENSQQDEIIESKIQESTIQSNSRQLNSIDQRDQFPVLGNQITSIKQNIYASINIVREFFIQSETNQGQNLLKKDSQFFIWIQVLEKE
ncbi:transmembrane protein, putative (macronuclear) [Tetrahymena thermophila SB210]|uniref:Transmembrane protein, putative n=1 Tax=Tetrahymena thermophila (strain SB210) TaxID=312017 RepID=Q23QY6_TETTS|nr:transmembrane protein, putative [Tetrahymena thermophila SB210]EAR98970.2 transmembrane protein, putative [Tetrahymena thermophila SB210]|eukprot:XP_001019215.2 transmembrane protein, putative [Tetrahymena thermophila SB210]